MRLFMNTSTKTCSIHREHVTVRENKWVDILTLHVSEEVFDILTRKASLEEYFKLADKLIEENK